MAENYIPRTLESSLATAIREGTGDARWLPDSVRAYCEENRLYSFSRSL